MSNSEPPKSPDSAPPAQAAAGEAAGESKEAPQALPPIDFSTFVMSLGSSAMVNLGQIPPPEGMESEVDVAGAKQIIDILGILEEKTRGNLDESEEKLLTTLLYDLRVHYVDAQRNK